MNIIEYYLVSISDRSLGFGCKVGGEGVDKYQDLQTYEYQHRGQITGFEVQGGEWVGSEQVSRDLNI